MSLGWRSEASLTDPPVSGLQSHTAGGVCAGQTGSCASEVFVDPASCCFGPVSKLTSASLG